MIDVFMQALRQAEQEADAVVQAARDKVKALERETASSITALAETQSSVTERELHDIEQGEAETLLKRRTAHETEKILSMQCLEEAALARRDRIVAEIISSITKH